MSRIETGEAAMVNPERASIALLIPCYNEEQTVAQVVTAFLSELPGPTTQ